MSLSCKLLVPALVLFALGGCYDRNAQKSEVIKLMQANGSGNLSTYTQPGLQQWFSVRQPLAEKVAAMCDPISKNSTADWAISAEGTACAAAFHTRAYTYDFERARKLIKGMGL
jgi:hypothetical protein